MRTYKTISLIGATSAATLLVTAAPALTQPSQPQANTFASITVQQEERQNVVNVPLGTTAISTTYFKIVTPATFSCKTTPIVKPSTTLTLLCWSNVSTAGSAKGSVTFLGRVAPFTFTWTANSSSLGSAASYAYIMKQPGKTTPIRWDPCKGNVTILLNLNGYPVSERANVQIAVDRIRNSTGLPVYLGGNTTVMPKAANRVGSLASQQVVVAFATKGTAANQSDIIPGAPVAGVGGYYAISYGGPFYANKGFVVLDKTTFTNYRLSTTSRIAVYMHELGHVFGLGHINDRTQEMNPTVYAPAIWGNGDLTGLRNVGAIQGCVK